MKFTPHIKLNPDRLKKRLSRNKAQLNSMETNIPISRIDWTTYQIAMLIRDFNIELGHAVEQFNDADFY